MSFKDFLSLRIKESSLTRKECIAKLNFYHIEFDKLDSVTLSRWITGKTTPSLYKQTLICIFFKYNIFHFIKEKHYTLTTKSKLLSENFYRIIERHYRSPGFLHYNYSKYDQPSYLISKKNIYEYRESYYNFYRNFSIYKRLFSFIDTNNLEPQNLLFEEYIKGSLSSHCSICYISKDDNKHFQSFFNVNIDLDEYWFSNISYLRTSECVFLSFTLLSYLMYKSKNENFISLLLGEESFSEHSILGYKQISPTIYDSGHKLYLTKANIYEVISNPFVISEINRILNQYDIDSFFSQEIKNKYFKR